MIEIGHLEFFLSLLVVVVVVNIVSQRGNWLSGWDNPLPMFVIITWLWRPTPQALSTRLTSVTSDLTSFTFSASMWSSNSLSYTIMRRFWGILWLLQGWARRRKALNWRKSQLLEYQAVWEVFSHVWNIVDEPTVGDMDWKTSQPSSSVRICSLVT